MNESIKRSSMLDWIGAGTALWFVFGAYIDARAHILVPELETFFTPWHFVFYSGGMAILGVTLVSTWLHYRSGFDKENGSLLTFWKAAPPGYGGVLPGGFIFFLSGIGDLLWHEAFGLEVGIEPLLSPTHLGLAIGGGMMVLGPYRAALTSKVAGLQDQLDWPALISITMVFSMVVFFLQYAIPLAGGFAWVFTGETDHAQSFGAAKMVIHTGMLLGMLIYLDQRWILRRNMGLGMMLFHGALISLIMIGNQPSMVFWTFEGFSKLLEEGRIVLLSCLITGVIIDLSQRIVRRKGLSPYLAVVGGSWVASMFFAVWILSDVEIGWGISGWMGVMTSTAILGWLAGLMVDQK